MQYNIYVASKRDLGGFPVIQDGSLKDGADRKNFFFKEILVCPMRFSHFPTAGTVFYSYCIKLSVSSLSMPPEDSEQMMRTIARGANAFESTSSEQNFSHVSCSRSYMDCPSHFFLVCVLSHCW